MMTLERRHDLIKVLKPYFLPKRLHSTKSYFIKAIDHTFYGFTGVITHAGCWERTRGKVVNYEPKASDLQAFRVFSQHPMSMSIMTRTANLRDLLENLFDSSSSVEHATFCSETSLFHFAEAGVTPIGDRS